MSQTTPREGTLPLSICLFGPFEVFVNGLPLPRLRSRKVQWLLALLALRSGRDTDRAWLAGTLWPDSDESAAFANLRSSLKDLRRALGPQAARLHAPDDTSRGAPRLLCLDLEGAEVDVRAFDAAVSRGDPASLQQAVGLYRGPLLEACAEAWVVAERERREQAYLTALEQLAQQALDAGDGVKAEGYLRRAAGVDPLRESVQRGLMRALAMSGNYAAALMVYRELRLLLQQELRAEPDPETTALFERTRAEARGKAALGSGLWALGKGGRSPLGDRSVVAPTQSPEPRAQSGSEATYTFLFTDVEGSTRLWEEQPEAMREAMACHDALLREIVTAHGGRVFKTMGDQFCVTFVTAAEALAAALAGQQGLQTQEWGEIGGLRVRMALHTGAAQEREGDYFGPTVNRVARLLAAAHGGQVLLSRATEEWVRATLPDSVRLRDMGSHRLKDLQQPERLFQLVHPSLPAEFPPVRSLEAFAHNLPVQWTSFIGREEAMAEVKALLTTTHLLTLTGSGGCGKTRLALQVAADLVEEYADGVWLVELAALSDPEGVPQAVVSALGVREEPGRPLTATLIDALRPRQLLLLLDNCEHLLAACAQLADNLLRACPRLRILASSREGLAMPGELTYRVPSLSLPDMRRLPPVGVDLVATLTQYEAVRLFQERAAFSQPGFAMTEQNAASVAAVCQRLDGIPLAIELAAARVKALPVEKIAERLDDRFRLLTGGSRTALPRQQTLRALIDWSYDLLSEQERTLLRRLSVFAGGWTLEAAETVCAGQGIEGWEVLDLLTSLVEKSLVLYDEQGGEGRYRLLETVRQYARDRLLEAEQPQVEAVAVRDRHRDWFVELAERSEPELRWGTEQASWMERLEREHDNVRAALEWCLASEEGREAALRAVAALAWFWTRRGHLSEGSQWATRALAAGRDVPVAIRGKALAGAMMLARDRIDDPMARALASEGVALGRETGDCWLIAVSLYHRGSLRVGRDPDWAQSRFEEALALAREVGDPWLITTITARLAFVAECREEYALGSTLHHEALRGYRELNDTYGIGSVLHTLGGNEAWQGNYAAAEALWSEALALLRARGDRSSRTIALLADLGSVAHKAGDDTAKARYEEALSLARELKDTRWTSMLLRSLAGLARSRGDLSTMRALTEEALSLEGNVMQQGHMLLELGDLAGARSRYEKGLTGYRALNDTWATGWGLLEVGHAAWLQGDLAITRSNAVEALGLFQRPDGKLRDWVDQNGILAAVESLALVGLMGRKAHAARLFGAVEALREGLRLPRHGHNPWRRPGERVREAVRAACVRQEYPVAWAEGRAMTLEAAVRVALSEMVDGSDRRDGWRNE